MPERPGGALAKRPLQFFYVVDVSGSMTGTKIESLNLAVRESIKPMQDVADENPNADVLVRVIKFSDGAQWQLSQPTEIRSFAWTDLDAGGSTDMGHALRMLADALKIENMPTRGLPPVIVLITDGMPTDDFNSGLKALMDEPWGKRAVRIGVAIGEDADLASLEKFIGNPEVKPLRSNNVQDLVKKIKWASTVPLKAASSPVNQQPGASATNNVPMPSQQPVDTPASSPSDIF